MRSPRRSSPTSTPMPIDKSRLVERFLRYVGIETTSDPSSDRTPSSDREWDLARLLVDELRGMGLEASVDDHCYVTAAIPATGLEGQPVIGLIAHLDTSPDASGRDVRPRIVDYRGGDIPLSADGAAVLSPERFPELSSYIGQELIVTDGTTLLGADDKAGVAAIMELAAHLAACPEVAHGEVRIAFTPDEEIGRGADLFDVEAFGADFAYTVDGGAVGELQFENFNAASAAVVCEGLGVHPGEAKGKMVNALHLARDFDAALPDQTPATTEGREGFYHLVSVAGTAERAELHYILRDFDAEALEERKDTLVRTARALNTRFDRERIRVTTRDQYRNMLDRLVHRMYIVDHAAEAMKRLGIRPVTTPIRGGTDGATLSYKGLPCPNLFAGGLAFHGVYEYLPIPSLVLACETLLEIVTSPVRQGA